MSARETVWKYYDGLAQKSGWQSLISDEMTFGGTGVKSAKGKDAYIQTTNNFLRSVKTCKVKEMIVEGDRACTIVTYDMVSPKGSSAISDIAEVMSVKNEKIDSSVIFFDTAAFRDFMAH